MAFNTKGALSGGLGGAASGAAIGSIVPGIGTVLGAGIGGLLGAFGGSERQRMPNIRPQSLLRPEQEALYRQAVNAGMQPGAGGAFGASADYYRDLLSDNSADANAFMAPELRRYYQDIVPNLSEQFAGMGSGGLGSSGFRNAQIQGATDLGERLAAIRANLRQSAAAGLQNIGQVGLGRFSENVYPEPQPSFGAGLSSGFGQGLGSAIPSFLNRPQGQQNQVGANTSPYGGFGKPPSSPQLRQFGSSGAGNLLPNYLGR